MHCYSNTAATLCKSLRLRGKCQLMDLILYSVPLMHRLIRTLSNTCHTIKRLYTVRHYWHRLWADDYGDYRLLARSFSHKPKALMT